MNDPGGYHAVSPVYEALDGEDTCLILTGAAAEIDDKCKTSGDFLGEVKAWFSSNLDGILVTGTSWKNENEMRAVSWCRDKGITTVSIIDYWSNYLERFKLNNDYIFPDYVFVMDDVAKAEAIDEGIPQDILIVAGQPVIDKYLDEKKKKQTSNGRALFLSQPLRDVNGHSMGYTEFDVVIGVINACRELNIPVDIKFHPKESDDFKNRYRKYAIDGKLDNLIACYEVIIGMCTMGLLQCSLMGKKTISYQPGLVGRDMCITNRVGLTKGAYRYDELVEQLRGGINETIEDGSKPIWCDGKSTERCVRLLKEIYDNSYVAKL